MLYLCLGVQKTLNVIFLNYTITLLNEKDVKRYYQNVIGLAAINNNLMEDLYTVIPLNTGETLV